MESLDNKQEMTESLNIKVFLLKCWNKKFAHSVATSFVTDAASRVFK